MQHRLISGQAKNIVEWAKREYPLKKSLYPNEEEYLIHMRMIFGGIDEFYGMPEPSQKKSEACLQTIQGTCYIMGIVADNTLNGQMISRLVQFTLYIDKFLYEQGFPSQTLEQKTPMLKDLDIYYTGWELAKL